MALGKLMLLVGAAVSLLASQIVASATAEFATHVAPAEEEGATSGEALVLAERGEEAEISSAGQLGTERPAKENEEDVGSYESPGPRKKLAEDEASGEARPAEAGRLSARTLVRSFVQALALIPAVWNHIRHFFFRLGGKTADAIDSAKRHAANIILRRRFGSPAGASEVPRAETTEGAPAGGSVQAAHPPAPLAGSVEGGDAPPVLTHEKED